jgi:serine phosphatase RsbU (regulator of sigma subunit)
LCVIDRKKAVLNFAGANNPLYMLRNNELTEIKGDKMPIGYYEKKDPFTNHKITIQSGDVFYLFSDGFIDQFGGPDGKKYLSRNFRKFLQNNASLPMQEQKNILYEEYQNWRGSNYQIDDILVIGFRI